jgi:subtilase family serine protease
MPLHFRRIRTGLVATTAAAVGLAVSLPAGASAAPAADRVQIDNAPSWTSSAASTGAVADTTPVRLTAVLALRDMAAAQKLATAVSDPTSSQYRHYVTPAAWRTSFAPTSDQIASVTSWLTSQGFTVGTVPANGRYVSFTGTAKQAEDAFGTSLSGFVKSGAHVVANTAPVTIPSALSGLVAGIGGLDTSVKATPDHTTGVTATSAKPLLNSHALSTPSTAAPTTVLPPPGPVFRNAGPCSAYFGQKTANNFPDPLKDTLTYAVCGYKPPQMRGAYGLDQTQAVGLDGRGVTVAVVDAYASPSILGDAQTYANNNDPSHPLRSYQFRQNLAGSFSSIDECGPASWYSEETLDVEAVHAMAPGANILYMGAQSCQDPDMLAAVNTVVDNGLAQIITNSYGTPGEPTDISSVIQNEQTSLQAAAEGITILFSSGDNGDEIANTGSRQVDYQASDPFVTAVGGTNLHVGKANNWGREIGWGTGKSILTNGVWAPLPPAYLYGGGGGTSALFEQPSYQAGVVPDKIAKSNGTSTPMRAVPDIAMDGDPQSGLLIGQSQTFPDGSIQYSEYRIGGTSLSSPLMAGLIAVYDQTFQGSLGFLNPLIYFLSGTAAYHDVNDGTAVTTGVVRVDYKNAFDASAGLTTSLRTENQTGTIWTRKGYDDVTGVGTPNGVNFLLSIAGLLGAPGSVKALAK